MPTAGAKRIREFLDRREMTQAAFAEILGTTDASLSRILHGVHGPSLDMALRIKDATGGYVMPEDFRKDQAEGVG